MKIHRTSKYCGLALAAMMLTGAGQVFAQTADLTINTFDSDPGGNVGHEWGSGTQAYDPNNGNPPGSELVTADFSNSSDTPCTTYFCLNGNPWYVGTAIDFSQYKAIEFDIKWDNTSDITIGQFNDVSTIPTTATNSSGQLILNSPLTAGQITGLEIDYCGGPQGQMAPLVINTNIPAAAANGWVHMVIPINSTVAGIDGCSGFVFHKWVSQYTNQIANDFQARFWIDNIVLQGTAGPPPPPTVSAPVKAVPGLALTAITGPYNRESIRSVNDESWGAAGGPVNFSFTIAQGVNGATGAQYQNHIFLTPSPGAETSPDWNEANVIFMDLEATANGGASWTFRYKTNEPNGNAMLYATNGALASIVSSTPVGTWTLGFNGDAVTMSGPGGISTNFSLPAGTSAGNFPSPVQAYFGCQANNATALGAQSVLSEVKITGTANPLDDVFASDMALNTNVWTEIASDNAGAIIVPANSAYWFNWTLPDTGFSLIGSSMLNTSIWQDVSGTIVSEGTKRAELVSASSLPNSSTAYYRLIKRTFSQLQVLLPGETNAPNTVSGKVGTPLTYSFSADNAGGYVPVNVTINAVDSAWHIISSVTDTINVTSTDNTGIDPLNAALASGTLTEEADFGQSGTFTVTAMDVGNTNILSNTSSQLIINP